jgi:hypothetical protein
LKEIRLAGPETFNLSDGPNRAEWCNKFGAVIPQQDTGAQPITKVIKLNLFSGYVANQGDLLLPLMS